MYINALIVASFLGNNESFVDPRWCESVILHVQGNLALSGILARTVHIYAHTPLSSLLDVPRTSRTYAAYLHAGNSFVYQPRRA